MKVFVNRHDEKGKVAGRVIVDSKILQEKRTTYLVLLPDGNTIVRKKGRDIPSAQQLKDQG